MTVYADELDDFVVALATASAARGEVLTSTVGVHPTLSPNWFAGMFLADRVRLFDALTPSDRYKVAVNIPLLVQDVIQRGFPATLTSNISLHSLTVVTQAVTVVNRLQLRDPPFALVRYAEALLQNFNFRDSLLNFLGGLPLDSMGFADTLEPIYQATARVNERAALADLLGGSLLFRIDLTDDTEFDDVDLLQMLYRGDAILDSFQIFAAFVDPGGGSTTWAVNTRTGAITEYDNYAFNSMCKFGHHYLGADATGLWTLEGNLDDTMTIPTRIKSGWMQIAGSRFTSFKAAYLGMRITDTETDVILKLHAGDGREYVYAVRPQNQQTTKVNMGKGLRSRYFSFELLTAGEDFDLDSVEFVPIASRRRV
jgi:hypothetical protein